jgi:hypothetical protein
MHVCVSVLAVRLSMYFSTSLYLSVLCTCVPVSCLSNHSFTQITSVPEELGQLRKLRVLNLGSNRITSIPGVLFTQLSTLQVGRFMSSSPSPDQSNSLSPSIASLSGSFTHTLTLRNRIHPLTWPTHSPTHWPTHSFTHSLIHRLPSSLSPLCSSLCNYPCAR